MLTRTFTAALLALSLAGCGRLGDDPGDAGVARLVGLPAPPENTQGAQGVILAGSGRGDIWYVDSLPAGPRVDHFDGRGWRMIAVPTGVPTQRGPVQALAGGNGVLWLAATPAQTDARFALARIEVGGAIEDHGDELPVAPRASAIQLWGRGGEVVVVLSTDGVSTLFQYDGHRFVEVPRPPLGSWQVVGAPGGREIWAAAPLSGLATQPLYRFDGTAWTSLGDAPRASTWMFASATDAWSITPQGDSVVHYDGHAFSSIPLAGAAGGTSLRRAQAVLPTTSERAAALYANVANAPAGGHRLDVFYRSIRDGAASEMRDWRVGIELDAPTDNGFLGSVGAPVVLDDGTQLVPISAAEQRGTLRVRTGYVLMTEGGSL